MSTERLTMRQTREILRYSSFARHLRALQKESAKPLIGVRDSFSPTATLAQIEAELPERVAVLLGERRNSKASRHSKNALEKRIEATVIRRALACNLRLDGLGTNLRFLAGQWRMALGAAEYSDSLAHTAEPTRPLRCRRCRSASLAGWPEQCSLSTALRLRSALCRES
jgi:hypothetical protein